MIAARDLRGDLAQLLGDHPPGLFLLRPDRYVAAFFPAENTNGAAEAIAALVRGTWPSATSESPARSGGTA
jgi:hypothetical protein